MYVQFLVDNSGSMSMDYKHRAVLDELRTHLGPHSTTISGNDIIDVNLFNYSMTKLFNKPMKKKHLDMNRLTNNIPPPNGGTALYDVTYGAITGIQDLFRDNESKQALQLNYHDTHKYLIVLTDGEDVGSVRTHSQLRELIRNPNLPKFHLLLIGVGLNAATTALMQGLCSSKVCTYIPCGSDYNMVKAAVAKAVQQVQIIYTASLKMQGTPEQVAAMMGNLNLAGADGGDFMTMKALPAPQARRNHGGPSCTVTDEGSRGRSASRRPAQRW
ncbi:hypothetical protein OEZ86_010526 [Tetradesmus obliquus]|nr:hypothetical protein OEZ86_010526 [Tetradesmus obliquus]